MSTPSQSPAPTGLSVPQGAALTLGAVIGTGVLSLPALAAGVAGPASLIAWLALVVLSIPLAATFAALGARFPDGGGVSTYARHAFGARASTVIGWCFYFAVPLGAPPAAGFAGAYVADSVGGGRTTQLVTCGVLIVVVAIMNYFGIRVSASLQLMIAAVLATLLALAIVVSLPHADLGNLTPFAPFGWAAVGSAAALLVWAFAGWEAVSSLSGEYRNPARDIPRATTIAVAIIAVLYLGIAFATVTVLGPDAGKAPLSDLLVLGFGESARPVTTVVAVLLTLGAINAYFAGTARLGAALGRDGSLPAWFAAGSEAGSIPRRSLLVVTGLSLATLAGIGAVGIEAGVHASAGHRRVHPGVRRRYGGRDPAAPAQDLGLAVRGCLVRRDPGAAVDDRRAHLRRARDRGGRAGLVVQISRASCLMPGSIDSVTVAP